VEEEETSPWPAGAPVPSAVAAAERSGRWLRRAGKEKETDGAGLLRAEGEKAAREGAGLRDAASIAWAWVPVAAAGGGGPGGEGDKRNEWSGGGGRV
jgi:hypothetical protein